MPSLLVYGKVKLRTALTEKRRRFESHLEPANLDDLIGRLRRNEVKEMKLGWTTSNFLHDKRSLSVLEKALKLNTSVTSISIGWRWHGRRHILIKLLQVIAKYTTNTQLIHLKLVLDEWVPDTVLTSLFHQQQNLVTIDLQAVQVLKQNKDTGRLCCSRSFRGEKTKMLIRSEGKQLLPSRTAWVFSPSATSCDHSVVTHCIVPHYHRLAHLKTLSLIECDLTDSKVIELAQFLHIRGGISVLVLRSNRRLTGQGLRMICQAPVMKKLDLSLCDLESEDVLAVAQGIAARPWPVEELLLAGNYRMGTVGLLALTHQNCCQKMVSLNISDCDAKEYRLVLVVNALAALQPCTTLQRIQIHGSWVASDAVAEALHRLLISDSALRSIQLDDPQQPKPLTPSQLKLVLAGLQQNYEMEELTIDFLHTIENVRVWKDVSFFLRLNIAGRRILRSQAKPPRAYSGFPVAPVDDWCRVLEKAGNDSLNVLNWIVRNSSEAHFRSHRPTCRTERL